MNKEQAQNLMNVANAVEDAITWNANFHMRDFGDARKFVDQDKIPDWVPHGCGAPSCALGHYAVRKDLQDVFTLTSYGYLKLTPQGWREYKAPYFHLIGDHFGLNLEEMKQLFEKNGCNRAGSNAKKVVEYIHNFLHKKGWEMRG